MTTYERRRKRNLVGGGIALFGVIVVGLTGTTVHGEFFCTTKAVLTAIAGAIWPTYLAAGTLVRGPDEVDARKSHIVGGVVAMAWLAMVLLASSVSEGGFLCVTKTAVATLAAALWPLYYLVGSFVRGMPAAPPPAPPAPPAPPCRPL